MRRPEASRDDKGFLHYPPMQTKAMFPIALLLAFSTLAGCASRGGIAPLEESPPVDAVAAPAEVLTSEIAMLALGQLGVPYAYGGAHPTGGFDCSGLVGYVYRQATGISLPRTTQELARTGRKVSTSELEPGDLVFYNTLGRRHSHVGIYLGDQRFVHAPSSGGVVRIEDMRLPYWRKRYNGARRALTELPTQMCCATELHQASSD